MTNFHNNYPCLKSAGKISIPILITALLSILIAASFFYSLTREKPEENIPKLNIALQIWVGYGPLYLAAEKGFFKEEGMELVFVDEELDSARRDAFKQGILDCEAATMDQLVSKRAVGTPVVAVLELDHSVGSDGIVASKDIKSVEDLAGKRVAFASDDVGELLLSYLLHKRGMSLDDMIIIPEEPGTAWLAFLNGEADAVVTWEPWISKAAEREGSHILITTRDEPNIIIDILNVREDIVKNDPELVRKLIRAWFRAIEYYKEHPVESSGIIAKYYNIMPEKYREQVEGLKWNGYDHQILPEEEDEHVKTFDIISEIKFADGRIPEKPDAHAAINMTLLRGLYEDSR